MSESFYRKTSTVHFTVTINMEKCEKIQQLILRTHSPWQHFGVGTGSKAFRYFKTIKRQPLSFLHKTLVPLMRVAKFTFNLPLTVLRGQFLLT